MMPYDEIFASHGNVFLKFYEGSLEISHNGVESFAEVQKRVFDIVDFVKNEHKEENVVLVTHMDPIKAMIGKVLSLEPEILFQLIIANASLNIFKYDDQNLYLSSINSMIASRFHETF
jgi:probable phosphoglycerate mutase